MLVAYAGAAQLVVLDAIASLAAGWHLDTRGPDDRGLVQGWDVRGQNVRVLPGRESATGRGSRCLLESEHVATELVTTAVERLQSRGLRASGVIREADRTQLAAAILAEALDVGARAILLTGPLPGRLAALMFASTSRGVVRRARCPVFVACPPRGQGNPATGVATRGPAGRRRSSGRGVPGPRGSLG